MLLFRLLAATYAFLGGWQYAVMTPKKVSLKAKAWAIKVWSWTIL